MTIYQDSRYETATVARVGAADGSTRNTILPSERPVSAFYTQYTVVDGDRIDIISNHFLGDAQLWWRIADLNPNWFWWDALPPGLVLRIPNDAAPR